MRRHVVGKPDVTSYYGILTDPNPAKDRRVGIHCDIVFQDGVARLVQGTTALIVTEILGTEGDSLIVNYLLATLN